MLKIYLITCLVMSLLAFLFFAADKLLAVRKGKRRIPEITLLSFAVLGGGVGAFLGRLLLRHKSNVKRKLHFAIVLTASLLIQIALGIFLIL